ncbi:MAG: hypothetical protein OJF49_001001 [Ktedonobacterales bacterium]|jgi:hypothetical protein|nr:MAG: hypothetical protein OJF49_001001 [Ktedonobacterales bacterium]
MKRQQIVYVIGLVIVLVAAAGLDVVVGTPASHSCQTAALTTAGNVRFNDTQQHTSFVVQTDTHAPDAGKFTYLTANGAQYRGGPASGLTTSAASMAAGDPLACAGYLHLTFDGTTTLTTPGAEGHPATNSQATIHLVALLNLAHLTASTTLTDNTNHTSFTTVTSAPPDMRGAVNTYTQAAIQQDWQTVYPLLSRSAIGSYSESQFAAAMKKQVDTVGALTAATITSAPQVHTTTLGVTYFTVNEQVTMTRKGTPTTTNQMAVYVLEDNAWKLWFTQPAQA